MQLNEITPHPISSVVTQNWRAKIPGVIAGAIILIPAAIFQWPSMWISIAVAAAAVVATDEVFSKLRQRWRAEEALAPRELPDPPATDLVQRTERWTELFAGSGIRSFVLFSYGTCIVLVDDETDPAKTAKQLLQEFGPAVPGTPSADMLVYPLSDTGDYVVGGRHPNILTFVPRDMLKSDAPEDARITAAAFRGRDLRTFDAFAQHVIHISQSD